MFSTKISRSAHAPYVYRVAQLALYRQFFEFSAFLVFYTKSLEKPEKAQIKAYPLKAWLLRLNSMISRF